MRNICAAALILLPTVSFAPEVGFARQPHTPSLSDSISIEMSALSNVESSGGKNLNHEMISSGIHAGDRAGGHYGLMPLTVKMVIGMTPNLKRKYGKWIAADHSAISHELNKNRTFDNDVARAMWTWLRATKPVEQAACSWFWGPWEKNCSRKNVRDLEYVKKYLAQYRKTFHEYAQNSQ